MRLSNQTLRNRAGHSIIEVMIGMTILAIALSSAFALSINSSTLFHRNQKISSAVNLADYKMEEMRNTEYIDIIDGYDANPMDSLGTTIGSTGGSGIYYRWWWVTNNDPQPGMKTIMVLVGWYERGWLRVYPLVAVVSE